MYLNQIAPNLGSKTAKKRVGRGIGSGFGKTAGRGHKGQKSRSGGFHKIGFEGGQMPLYRRLPKRGFKALNKKNIAVLNLSRIQDVLDKYKKEIKENIDLKTLKDKKIINKKYEKLKILGKGELKTKLEISAHYTKQAQQKIEKAGGKVSIIKK